MSRNVLPPYKHKTTSTTTQLLVVFDMSAKLTTYVSLNNQLLVGPTVHAPLIDVILLFRQYRVALTTDISRMYRAVLLPEAQRDLHRFVWRRHEHDILKGYRMTRLTFGISASSLAANMAGRTNTIRNKRHPFIMPSKHLLTKMIVEYEHSRLLHMGPTVHVNKNFTFRTSTTIVP